MRTLGIAAIVLAASTVAVSSASAADGCGYDRHRNSVFGHCHWDGPPPPPPGYFAPPPPPPPAYGPAYYGGPAYAPVVVDRWYPGRGYWDGRRYWGHRARWYGGWRYH